MERRRKQAEDRIARAEAQAAEEVRAAAVDMAIAAAEKVLREKAAGVDGAREAQKNRMHGRQDVAARLRIVRGFTRLPYCDAAMPRRGQRKS